MTQSGSAKWTRTVGLGVTIGLGSRCLSVGKGWAWLAGTTASSFCSPAWPFENAFCSPIWPFESEWSTKIQQLI